MPDSQSTWVTIHSNILSACIDPFGAQLSELKDSAGRDLLWNGDPSIWAGRAPLLFPIVGALAGGQYRLGARSYSLPRHGFARNKLFDVVESSATASTFRLTADAGTRELYPFEFELDVRYSLVAATLNVAATVRNLSQRALPASFGYHPALRWPLPFGHARAEHFIEFACDEPAPVRRLDQAGLLVAEGQPSPIVGKRLALTDELFKNDVVIFDEIHSRSVTYGAETGPRIEVRFPDATYLGLWTKVGAGFICIEPWQGIADPQGYAGDFTLKPGSFLLAPETKQVITMSITLLP